MADGNDARVEAFARFRDALRQHFIPEATLVKAFNTAWNAGYSSGIRDRQIVTDRERFASETHVSGREDER